MNKIYNNNFLKEINENTIIDSYNNNIHIQPKYNTIKDINNISTEIINISYNEPSLNIHKYYNNITKNKKLNIYSIVAKNIKHNKKHYKPQDNILNNIDRLSINYYTRDGYNLVNNFLIINSIDQTKLNINEQIIKFIMKKIIKNSLESDYDYYKRCIYYYFINLYNALQKRIPYNIQIPFKMYRGVGKLYLKNDSTHFYYLDSFNSTTISKQTITDLMDFDRYMYVYYIHPNCMYMNIKPYSKYAGEEEIILSPYNRYIFIKSNEYKSVYYYLILPPDIIHIPKKYEDFIEWQKNIKEMSIPYIKPTSGGKELTRNILKKYNKKNKKMTHHKKNINIINNTKNITRRKSKMDLSENKEFQDFIKRFNGQFTTMEDFDNYKHFADLLFHDFTNKDFIMYTKALKKFTGPGSRGFVDRVMFMPTGSFRGNEPTPKEKDYIEQVTKMIEND
jgi:hypothetical protein